MSRPTIPMAPMPTIPVLGPKLSLNRINLVLPVGMSIMLTVGDRDQQVEYRVLKSGSHVTSGYFLSPLAAWLGLETNFTGDQRVRLSCWLRSL